MQERTASWGICLNAKTSSLCELMRGCTPFPWGDVPAEWGVILISEVGVAHCGVEQRLTWNLFKRNLSVFFPFLMALFLPPPAFSPSLCVLWDTLPTFSLNFTNYALPSVGSPNILSCSIAFFVEELDQTTSYHKRLFYFPFCLCFTVWLNEYIEFWEPFIYLFKSNTFSFI